MGNVTSKSRNKDAQLDSEEPDQPPPNPSRAASAPSSSRALNPGKEHFNPSTPALPPRTLLPPAHTRSLQPYSLPSLQKHPLCQCR
ncbi:hypothetical protein SKAU_G00272210 [Synaphobranchus kaupii]|uniref:Uncharacterized protein n=1 Tax=Synaphobranchus kaupii TaxID=118154 RepID=A0A9Q1IQH9_SYNKA|nr:hypothetical protein SKAU_G00272210 [Synaphobranchus kaupii]